MKYIMFTVDMSGTEMKLPVVFPNTLIHKKVAQALMPMLREEFSKVVPTSAGEFNIADCTCSGESITLNLHSGKNDSSTIK